MVAVAIFRHCEWIRDDRKIRSGALRLGVWPRRWMKRTCEGGGREERKPFCPGERERERERFNHNNNTLIS